jgi:hypothetical protein
MTKEEQQELLRQVYDLHKYGFSLEEIAVQYGINKEDLGEWLKAIEYKLARIDELHDKIWCKPDPHDVFMQTMRLKAEGADFPEIAEKLDFMDAGHLIMWLSLYLQKYPTVASILNNPLPA